MLLAATWDDLYTHTYTHTHTHTHTHRYSSSSSLFSILPLCKCVFCSSSATRSFIHELEMEKRWANLFTANFGSLRCVVFVCARVCACVHTEITSVKIIWMQFSPFLYDSFVNKAWFFALRVSLLLFSWFSCFIRVLKWRIQWREERERDVTQEINAASSRIDLSWGVLGTV